jgi:hypothetical protein
VNSWTKRAIGVAALAGGLLALGAGTASADEASTRASVRVGSAPTAEVRLCADGVALSGLLGRCGGQAGSGSDGTTVQAGATNARVRVSAGPARASLETRPSRPGAAVSGQVRISRPARLAPSVNADVAADTSPRARVAVEAASPSVHPLGSAPVPSATAKVAIMLAREGTADGADATATVDLAIPPATADAAVEVDLFGAADEADATATVDLAVPPATADAAVAADLLGPSDEADATVDATLAVGHDAAATDVNADVAVALGPLGAADEATTADATLAVGLPELGDPAPAGADALVEVNLAGVGVPALDGVAPALPALPAPVGDIPLGGLLGGIAPPELGGGLVPSTSAEVCVGDCDVDTGTGSGGTPPPTQPAPTPPPADGTGGQDTSTGGITAPDQSGLTGTGGMLAGADRAAGATLARLGSALGGSGGTLAFTGGISDLLAFMALGLLLAGALLLRAARPAPVAERR